MSPRLFLSIFMTKVVHVHVQEFGKYAFPVKLSFRMAPD